MKFHARFFWRRARYRPGWKTAAEVPANAQALESFFKAGLLCEDCGGVELKTVEATPS